MQEQGSLKPPSTLWTEPETQLKSQESRRYSKRETPEDAMFPGPPGSAEWSKLPHE